MRYDVATSTKKYPKSYNVETFLTLGDAISKYENSVENKTVEHVFIQTVDNEGNYRIIKDNKHKEAKTNHTTFDTIVDQTFSTCRNLLIKKGGEYAGDFDRYANFKRNAERLGTSKYTIWAVYANKHYDALMQYITDINTNKTRERAEPITGRIDDIINYFLLLKGMIDEDSSKN